MTVLKMSNILWLINLLILSITDFSVSLLRSTSMVNIISSEYKLLSVISNKTLKLI